jgi:hypothetical protein
LASHAINDERDNPYLPSDTDCGVPYRIPAPKLSAFDLRGVGTGIEKGLRIIDRDAANEILRMVFVEAIGAILEICRPTSNNLDVQILEIISLAAVVTEPKGQLASRVLDTH